MTALRLVIFDVDGTLVDSQGAIVGAMTAAFGAVGLPAPARPEILSLVGLSLENAMSRLVPEAPGEMHIALAEAYRDAYHAQRQRDGAVAGSPLYPGARDLLERLGARDDLVLGVATGKSRRGLNALIEAHGLERHFVTRQVADDHPSKPHPAMVHAALAETGCAPGEAVMIGDTVFDMEMAAAAGVAGIGVGWGYHAIEDLAPIAAHTIGRFEELPETLEAVWADPT